MKKPIYFLFTLICFTTVRISAQSRKIAPCVDSSITKSADSLALVFKSQSFSLANSSSLTMESEYESAIIVDFKKGNWYVLAFVGAKSSKLFQVSMYDKDEHRVAYEKQKSFDKEGNILIFSYRPEESGLHVIRPLQSNRKSNFVCGQMMLFRKDLP